jgi:regulator of RNase E activity RraA
MTADADLLDQYLALDTATVSDALDNCGLPPGQGGLRPMWGRPRIVGFAVTVAQVPVTARGRLQQKSAGAPVGLGQVTVKPGDVVMADEGGVVVIPRQRAAEILAAARGVRAREEQIEAEVRAGVPLPQAMRDARLAGSEAP